jgi:adenosine kinase
LTASFMVTTDQELNQIASFFPGAMSEAREIELAPIVEKAGKFDLLIISPDDPDAMISHSQSARDMGIAFAADPSQQLARMDGEAIKLLIEGAKYLFLNEYELALTMQKTGWSDAEIFSKVEVRVITLGSAGARVEEHGKEPITVGVPQERSKIDPTGVGDCFRAGFVAGLAWGFGHERCAQIGSMLATFCIETKGTQEYRFTKAEFIERFSAAYGEGAAAEVNEKLAPRLVG